MVYDFDIITRPCHRELQQRDREKDKQEDVGEQKTTNGVF
jgi:hypothetical protein